MAKLRVLNLPLRVLLEIGIVAALSYWGFHTGNSTAMKILLEVGAPAVGFGLWSLIDFRRAGRFSEPLRLLQELVISGAAAVALYAAGQHALGLALGSLSVLYHALVYASGERLLNPRSPAASQGQAPRYDRRL